MTNSLLDKKENIKVKIFLYTLACGIVLALQSCTFSSIETANLPGSIEITSIEKSEPSAKTSGIRAKLYSDKNDLNDLDSPSIELATGLNLDYATRPTLLLS